MIDRLSSYLSAGLPLGLGTAQYLRLFRTVFLLVFASSILLHVLLEDAARPLSTFLHAASVGLAYSIVVALACAAVFATRKAVDRVRVWHIWLASFAIFAIGYFLLPLDAISDHTVNVGFLQLFPIWGLVTYFFIQPYLAQSVASEMARLRDVNALLEAGARNFSDNAEAIRFKSGKTTFALEARSIRNIAVDDHYCYVHYRHNDGYEKRDLAMPLRDVLAFLPAEFVQVHRSHIVNLASIRAIKRENRSIRLILDGGFDIPVSRRRLDELLPLLRQQLALNR